MSEDQESIVLSALTSKSGKTEDQDSSIDPEKRSFVLRQLSRWTRNIALGWEAEGFYGRTLGNDVVSMVTLIKVAEYFGADRRDVKNAILDGWNDSIDKYGEKSIWKLEKWDLDKSNLPELYKEELAKITIRHRTLYAKQVLQKKVRGLDTKRRYPEIKRIMSETLEKWQEEGVDFNNFIEPFFKIADLDIPKSYFLPEKSPYTGDTVVGRTLLEPVRDAYNHTIGEEARIHVKRIPAGQPRLENK